MPRISDSRGVQAGTTLTETLVALTIGSIVMGLVVSFVVRTQKNVASAKGRQVAQAEANEILRMLSADLALANAPVSGSSTAITIQTTTDTLTYQTSCQTAPAGLGNADFSSAMAAVNSCLGQNGCPSGTMPALAISRPNGQAARTYPQYLVTQRAAAEESIGTMACFNVSSTNVAIDLTSFFFAENRQVKQTNRHLLVPISNVSGVTLLPNP